MSQSSTTENPLTKYLHSCRVDKGNEHTHTSISKPSGAYYVSSGDHDAFMDAYKRAVEQGVEVFMTERHRHIGPVLIDMDFRFDPPSVCKRYNSHELSRRICELYAHHLSEYIDQPHMTFYVMEKRTGPILYKGLVKDGMHMVVPDVVTRPEIQHMVRDAVLHDLEGLFTVETPDLVNRIEDVVDEAVIERNNWMMYGSRKPAIGSDPYEVTSVFRWYASMNSLQDVTEEMTVGKSVSDLIDLFSIRNKFSESPIHGDRLDVITHFVRAKEEKQRKKEAIHLVIMKHDDSDSRQNTVATEDFDMTSLLVDLLSASRAESYNDWIRVGWCLRNIDHRLLDKWEEFSHKSPKYVDNECPRLWNCMRTGGLGIGTLHMWARQDSPERYLTIIRNDLNAIILQSANGTHYDVARVILHMYRYDYVCSSIKHKTWYEFREHRWHETDSAYTLRKKISTEVVKEYGLIVIKLQTQAISSTDEREQNRLIEICQKLTSISLQLKKTSFKDNVMRECCELFMFEKFDEMLDSNCSLLGFENGVYDLDRCEFRDGRPDDYISYSTGTFFIPFVEDHPTVIELKTFLSQIHPDTSIRNYVLRSLSQCLSGFIRSERFNIWTGSGSNGKSLTVTLMEKSFGDYCCKFPISLLTRQRAASNAACSEIARAKGRRFGVLQEPSEDERLNIGLMKELSGGDKIQCRELYKAPVEWRPQFKMFLLCNHLPSVPSDDGGTWRRIRVVEFGSKFVSAPSPENANEYQIDLDLPQKLDSWKEHFMAMLVNTHERFIGKPLDEPAAVLACTREYQRTNDHMADFVDSRLERCSSSALSLDDAFSELKEWIKSDNIPMKAPKKRDFQGYLDKTLSSRGIRSCGKHCYNGYKIITTDGIIQAIE